MNEVLNYLRELNMVSIILRIFIAVLFGGCIGLNREHKKMPAGIRTYMLVCLGSCLTALLAMYTRESLLLVFGESVKTDISRFPAQVINGIGFLGAGTIIFTEEKVRGVTTAACLWASGCMGIVIGYGFYECALVGFIILLFVVKVIPVWERKLRDIADRRVDNV